mgnify:CR=1
MFNEKWIKHHKWYRLQISISINGRHDTSWSWGKDVDGNLFKEFRELTTKKKIAEALRLAQKEK